MTNVAQNVGANRIVPGVAVTHPLGNPQLPGDQEAAHRRRLVEKAAIALQTAVAGQHVFA